MQSNTLPTWEVSSPTTQQQPKTLITASQKPAAPLVGYKSECGRTTPCACQPGSRQVYRAAVLTTLLYGAGTWVLYRKQLKLLERFHQRCLRSIMGITWQDYITNEEVLARADTTSVEAMLMLRQLHWAGHVTRMASSRMPKAVFYGELSQGKRDRGAPRKRFKDQLKRQLTQAGIDHSEWEALAEDREEWRGTIKTAADNFEEGRKTAAAEKRQRRNDSASQPVTDTTFTCPSCSRACRSRIGLHSHQRACRRACTSSQ